MIDDRVTPRTDIDAAVFIEVGERAHPDDTGEIVISSALDVSATGLQVVLDQGLKKGRIVRVCLDVAGSEPIFVVAKIMWQKGDGLEYCHGLMILEADNTDFKLWQRTFARLTRIPAKT